MLSLRNSVISSVVALGLSVPAMANHLGLEFSTTNRSFTQEHQKDKYSVNNWDARYYNFGANYQPMVEYPVSLGANLGFWNSHNATPSGEIGYESVYKGKSTCTGYDLGIHVRAWIPTDVTGVTWLGTPYGQVGYVPLSNFSYNSTESNTSDTKTLAGKNNGVSFVVGTNWQVTDGIGFNFAWNYDLRTFDFNQESKFGGSDSIKQKHKNTAKNTATGWTMGVTTRVF